MNRTIAYSILKSLEVINFDNESYNSVGPLNHQVVRFILEKATKLRGLRFINDIAEADKAFDNVRIVGPLRRMSLRNVSDATIGTIFQLNNTLRNLTFVYCREITNDGLNVLFTLIKTLTFLYV